VISRLKASFCSLLAAGFLAGCATSGGPIGEDPLISIAELTELPAPSNSGYSQGYAVEIVRPQDILSISVFGVEELSRDDVRVGLDGTFDYPLIGSVQADGRSLAEISYDLETRLAGTFVRNPDVQVDFVSRDAQVFTIGGEITRGGQYPIVQSTTLLEAVAIGGGRTDFAQPREVMIFREVNGERYIGVYDLVAIERGNYPDPEIFPHDMIVIGESTQLRRVSQVSKFVSLITSPLILLERLLR